MSGRGAIFGLLVALFLLILGLGGAKGWIAIVGIVIGLAIATLAIARQLRQ